MRKEPAGLAPRAARPTAAPVAGACRSRPPPAMRPRHHPAAVRPVWPTARRLGAGPRARTGMRAAESARERACSGEPKYGRRAKGASARAWAITGEPLPIASKVRAGRDVKRWPLWNASLGPHGPGCRAHAGHPSRTGVARAGLAQHACCDSQRRSAVPDPSRSLACRLSNDRCWSRSDEPDPGGTVLRKSAVNQRKTPELVRGWVQTITSTASPNGGGAIRRSGVVEAHSVGYTGGAAGNFPSMSVR